MGKPLIRAGRMGAAVLAISLLLTACSLNAGPHLRQPRWSAGISDSVHAPGQPFVVGSLFLCLDGAGEVTIDDVDLVEADRGMPLTGVAVRPNPILRGGRMIAMAPRSLEQVGLAGDGPHVVGIECQGNSGRGYELVVEIVRTIPTQVGSQALLVTYHNEHETEQVSLDMRIGLGGHEQSS